jgi:hypothetical protein
VTEVEAKKYIGKKIKCTIRPLVEGIVVGFSMKEQDFLIAPPFRKISISLDEFVNDIHSKLYGNESYWFDFDLCDKFKNSEYDFIRFDNVILLSKFYPNSTLFKTIYPNGTEEDGFWRVD